MLEYPLITYTLLLLLLYGVLSKISERSIISAPMVFVAFGILTHLFQFEELKSGIQAPWVKVVAEITLVLVLFNDASTLDLKALLKERRLPIRLLFIGLPITMVLGILIALPLFPSETIWLLALMALILSPTDAALGLAVVKSKMVPLKVRQAINVESGLNDGIALPPILLCLAVMSHKTGYQTGYSYWTLFLLKQFIFGPAVGGLVGWLGGKLIETASDKGWMNTTFQRLSSPAIAILSFSLAESVHGNGFIAAFFAGMLLGIRNEKIRLRLHSFGEAGSEALVLFVFLLFGMAMIPLSFPYWDLAAVTYALLSLTIIRMIPVHLSLLRTRLTFAERSFIGWFGPRGIASVLYVLLAVIEIGIEGHQRVFSVITLTVVLSVVLHGISAVPFTRLFKTKN